MLVEVRIYRPSFFDKSIPGDVPEHHFSGGKPVCKIPDPEGQSSGLLRTFAAHKKDSSRNEEYQEFLHHCTH
jgi:hypothetical protein